MCKILGNPVIDLETHTIEEEDDDEQTSLELNQSNIEKLSDEDFQGNFSDQEGRLVCLVCYKMFQPNNFLLLRRHLTTHPDSLLKKISVQQFKQKYFKCLTCNFQTTIASSFRAHCKTHVPKSFHCKICQKKFLSQKLLSNHETSKICDISRRKCEKCGKFFSDITRLKNHIKSTHSGIKPWNCGICNKAFSELRSLKEHKLIHEPNRKFKCTICDKKFVQKNHLKYHLASNHGQSDKILECQICCKPFAFPFQLRKHEKSHE